jgi:hypothetical protein
MSYTPIGEALPPKKKKPIPRPVYFETTIPVIRPCRSCGVWFAAGVAEGIKAEVEFSVLDLGQQIWAVLNRIELYAIRRSGLVYMDAMRLEGGSTQGELYPQHYCHVKWPKVTGPVRRPRTSDVPPY